MPTVSNLKLYRPRRVQPQRQAPQRPAHTLAVHSGSDTVLIEWRCGDIPHVVARTRAVD